MDKKTTNIHMASTRTGMSDVFVLGGKAEYEAKRLNANRNYFEVGCLCIKVGELKQLPKSTDDGDAVEYYEDNCKCSRNYKHLETDQ